jgi:hypothetical protein
MTEPIKFSTEYPLNVSVFLKGDREHPGSEDSYRVRITTAGTTFETLQGISEERANEIKQITEKFLKSGTKNFKDVEVGRYDGSPFPNNYRVRIIMGVISFSLGYGLSEERANELAQTTRNCLGLDDKLKE